MAYADNRMSRSRMTAIFIVAVLHALLGYALITGLAYNVVKKVAADLKTFNVEEEPPPPEEKPPPPPPDQPQVPPPVVPPPPKKVQPAKARANLASLFSDEDYPASAVRAGEAGATGFRLEVGPNGRVTNCSVTSSSGSSALDSTTCRLL